MSAADRRIIHVTLAEMQGLTTRSEGEGIYRHLIVIPTRDGDGGAAAVAARRFARYHRGDCDGGRRRHRHRAALGAARGEIFGKLLKPWPQSRSRTSCSGR